MKRKLKKLFKIAGPFNILFGSILVIRNYFLYRFFKFNSWHINSNYFLRPYKKVAVQIANSYEFINVIEIGCGLCDILSRINCKKKIGIDIDQNIINTCKLIFSNRLNFINGSIFDDLGKLNLINQNFDDKNLLICLNWPHGYPWIKIKESIKNLTLKNKVNYLMIDLINNDPTNNYKFRHRESSLLGLGSILIKKDIKGSNRTIYLVNLS